MGERDILNQLDALLTGNGPRHSAAGAAGNQQAPPRRVVAPRRRGSADTSRQESDGEDVTVLSDTTADARPVPTLAGLAAEFRELVRQWQEIKTGRASFLAAAEEKLRRTTSSINSRADGHVQEARAIISEVRGYVDEANSLTTQWGASSVILGSTANDVTGTSAENNARRYAREAFAALSSLKASPYRKATTGDYVWPFVVLLPLMLCIGGALTDTDSGGAKFFGVLIILGGLTLPFYVAFQVPKSRNRGFDQAYAALSQSAGSANGSALAWERNANAARQAELVAAQGVRDADVRLATEDFARRFGELRPRLIDYRDRAERVVPSWTDESWAEWQPCDSMPDVVRLGGLDLGPAADHLTVPATTSFPDGLSLLTESSGDDKERATDAIQSFLIRLVATFPPGKLQLTLFDPVGLGRNVSALMVLADEYPRLINSRAWTESRQFDQYLNELTDRIAEVHQKFLRKEFKTIADYNRTAKVPQPYHLLVVANFPAKFTEETANRLKSVAEAGPDCGVYTIVAVDRDLPIPYGFTLAELERLSTVIDAAAEGFVIRDPDFDGCILHLDAPPPSELSNRLLKRVAKEAEGASRVEVPFAEIAPPESDWWAPVQTTANGLDVPLGLAGATKRQRLTLGKDTAQHVLVAGRTGSGKSTLLHVLITNLALTYSPEELELYLIDFKKGVEFKTYAEHQLPHARVIAIQSEREFGLSVLQGLDAEMNRRGDLFRSLIDQNITEYRKATESPLPRILLIVDEFQEFFTEDDALSAQAGLILDRIIRQGRGFGVHALLASQTLAGAYTLNRATIDQMGVRIALQCSEADSRIILADDNPAARLLNRAGEAYYNDMNGRVEGNNHFQTVWLNDDERVRYLRRLSELAKGRGFVTKPTVFEGNAPSHMEDNPDLDGAFKLPDWPAPAPKFPVWLGEPIAMKSPTAAFFRRQSGSNLVIVGQDEAAALGIETAVVLSLAALVRPLGEGTTFYALDFIPVDSPHVNALQEVLLPLPHGARKVGRRGVTAIISEIEAEVKRRLDDEEQTYPSLFLVIHGLMRARDLRADDDGLAGYRSPFDDAEPAPPNPAQQLPTILRDGPDVGVHTIVWCDTLANLNRTLDRRLLREFDLRVAFQMGVEDSTGLIESPAASRLGSHRAILYSEEMSIMEKFRPHGLPPEKWLADTIQRLVTRAETMTKVNTG